MSKSTILFIKKKDLDFPRLLKETRLMECEVEWVRPDNGLCSRRGNPVEFDDEICPYCESAFGAYFDLNLIEGVA